MSNGQHSRAASLSDGGRCGTHGMTAFKPWVRTVSPRQALREHQLDVELARCPDDISAPVTLPSLACLTDEPKETATVQPAIAAETHHAPVCEPRFVATPSQRLANAAKIERERRIAAAARRLAGEPDALTVSEPIEEPPAAIATETFKEPWFAIVDEEKPAPQVRRVMVEDIQRAVCRHFGLSRVEFLSIRRTKNLVRPRQIAMYLAKTMTGRSFPDIGRRFGNRDHTTVLHALRKMEQLSVSDPDIAGAIAAITATLPAAMPVE